MPPPFEERFWAKVARGDRDACWLWQGSRTSGGYGHVKVGRRFAVSHRVAYEMMRGPIPEGLQIDHLCRVRACVNPWHLEPVTFTENMRRGEGWGGRNHRATACPKGHPYDEANTLWMSASYRGPYRRCRKCNADHARIWREAKAREFAEPCGQVQSMMALSVVNIAQAVSPIE